MEQGEKRAKTTGKGEGVPTNPGRDRLGLRWTYSEAFLST